MAKLLAWGEGYDADDGHVLAEGLSVADLQAKVGLLPDEIVAGPDDHPMFNRQTGSWAEAKDSYPVVQVTDEDAVTTGWTPGYYLLNGSVHYACLFLGIEQPATAL